MKKLCFLPLIFSLLFCASPQNTTPKKPSSQKTKTTKSTTKKAQDTTATQQENPLLSKSSSNSKTRWFVGAAAGANYSFSLEKPFAIVDLKTGFTYDNDWGRSYMYANISYAYLEGWNKNAQKSKGYFIDTLINTDLGVNLFESPSFSLLLMFGVGVGGRWIEQSYTQNFSYNQHDSFFITNLNIGLRSEIAREHVIALTLKPQLAKGWYQNRELAFEYFKEMSLLLSYTFWKF